jgi:colanic acid biosynthesis glycosyl transferase WcaI
MRILMLTQWFQPEPFMKGLPLAAALRDCGHSVEVLTGFPNYPGGKLYPGYRIRPWKREVMEGIPVTRVALYPSHDSNGLRRMLNYLSFGAAATLGALSLVRRPDVVYVYNLVTLSFAAVLLRRLKGCKVVLDVQDLWPESVLGAGMMNKTTFSEFLDSWCRAAYAQVDRLIVLSPGFRQNLVRRGIDADRIDVIFNWCDETVLQSGRIPMSSPEQALPANRFNIVFAGTMGVMQALDCVIEGARRLMDVAPDVFFTFVGGGIDVNRLKTVAADLPNVQFLSRRPVSEMAEIFAMADALLVHLKDDPLFEITIPSKIQAYLFAGKPILCGVKGDAAELVRRARSGIPFLPQDSTSLVQAILKLRALTPEQCAEMGNNGRAFYCEQLTMAEGVRRIEEVLKRTMETGGASPNEPRY